MINLIRYSNDYHNMVQCFLFLAKEYKAPIQFSNWIYLDINPDGYPSVWDGNGIKIPDGFPIPLGPIQIIYGQIKQIYVGSGFTLHLLCHDLAHWILASEEDRKYSDFNLSWTKPSINDRKKEIIVVQLTKTLQERCRSIMENLEMVETVDYVSSENTVKVSQDNQKVLDSYHQGRAKHFLNSLLVPMIKESVKKDRNQDTRSNSDLNFMCLAGQGASCEDKASKYLCN